ncbi:MAG: helix-turn-helix domain-containing protein, partial [Pirellulaceae bacterium]
LGISRRMVFEFRSKGELQYVKLGRLIRYRVSDIQMFLERKRIETNSHASEHSRAESRASRRSWHSQLPDLSRTATYPRRSVRNLRR